MKTLRKIAQLYNFLFDEATENPWVFAFQILYGWATFAVMIWFFGVIGL